MIPDGLADIRQRWSFVDLFEAQVLIAAYSDASDARQDVQDREDAARTRR